jgi:cytochrome c553
MSHSIKLATHKAIVVAGLATIFFAPPSAIAQTVDIAAGRKRAEVCMACHGENGVAITPGTPHLAGQDKEYLVKALMAYRIGEIRQDPTMTEMAKPLSDADIHNLAAFWHSLKARK